MPHPIPVRSRCRQHAPSLPWALAILLTTTAAAQNGAWAADTAPPGLAGRVFSFHEWRGDLYAGGFPFAAKGGVIRSLARWDGTAWQPVGGGVELVNGLATLPSANVNALVEYQGDLIVAGTFDTIRGQPHHNIARWDGTRFLPLGSGLQEIGWDADIRALAVYQTELYAAGVFDLAGGQPASGIARWNGTSWSPCGSGLGGAVPGTQGEAHSLLVVGNDLVVGGDFWSAGGVTARGVARWNGTTFAPMGAGFDGPVVALALHGGRLVAGGAYSFSGPTQVDGPALWNGSSWQALGSGGPPFVNALQSIGTELYAGGAFTSPGPYVARWNGTSWSNIGGVSGVFSGAIATVVAALGRHGDDLVVGGEFSRGGRATQGAAAVVSTNVITFDGTDWRPLGTGRGVHGTVARMLPWRGGWLAVGNFQETGSSATPHCAFHDGDTWRHFATFDQDLLDAVVYGGDLIVSGAFSTIDGQPIQRMARFDGSTWTQFGPPLVTRLAVHQGQLYSGGTTSLRRWNGSGWVPVATVAGPIDHLLAHANGNLYLSTATSSEYRVYRWDGSVVTQIGTANSFVHSLGSYGADLVVGGRFSTMNGAATNLLARWNGSSWSALGGGVTGYAVDSACELDGQLYIGANGDPRGFLLRFDGATWQAVPGHLEGLPRVLFADRATSSVHAFGNILGAGGRPVWNYGQWQNQPQWQNRLHGTGGSAGVPLLLGRGTFSVGSPWTLAIEGPASHIGVLGIGRTRVDVPLFGCTLVPLPEVLVTMVGDTNGSSQLATAWPPGMPPGLDLFVQGFLLDATGPQGWTATNALQCTAP